jgi:hypothetical protein
MSHIREPLRWTKARFSGYEVGAKGLILKLVDNTSRTMLYKNWDNAYPITLSKLKTLQTGEEIEFATWNGYDEKKWFCDVERISR